MNKKICILYTGGTIGMVPTENGHAPKKGYFRSLLDDISQLRHSDMPQWDLVEFDPLLDSSDISVNEWNAIGSAIAARYERYDGFVILHGTDTMAYTAFLHAGRPRQARRNDRFPDPDVRSEIRRKG